MMYASPQTPRTARAPRGSRGSTASRFTLRPLALALAAGSLLSLPGLMGQGQAHAQAAPAVLPSGLTVIQGQARAVTSGNRMTVTNSAGSILNWQSFSIGNGAGVHFAQPSATSQVLNRVTGNDPSSILGSLSSNGRVWLLNPNGVLFGQNARVDVAGLVASTLNLSNSDWSAGRYSLSALGSGAAAGVVNQGELRSSLGGHIALIGGSVRNEGLIESVGGQVLLAAGRSIDLVDTGTPNLAVRVTAPEGEALNLGTLAAAGGRIDVHGAVVNQHGVVRADSLGINARGEIVLSASQALNLSAGSLTSASGEVGGTVTLDSGRSGTTLVDGAVLSTGASGLGGDVTLLGRNVGLQGSALVDASGYAGGGQVRVGGGERGQDSTVPNADAVYVGQGARISADATGQGNGGRVILWGNKATRAYGSFTAHGGALGGNGGFIETSGGWIDVRPTKIDATASLGVAGTWLLDPWNLLITGPVDTLGVSPFPFTTFTDAVASGAQIAATDIVTALNAGNSVVITTGTTGTEAGDITVRNANLVAAPSTAVGLTLQAARDIVVTGSTFGSSNTTPVSLTLQAGLGVAGQGRIELNGGSTITTRGGDVSMTGKGYYFEGAPANSGYGIYLLGSTINAGTGKVTLVGTSDTFANATRGVSIIGGSITAGSISLNGTASTSSTFNGVAGVEVNSASLSAASIDITGNSGASASPFTNGVVFEGATVTATDTLTVSGTSSGTGVLGSTSSTLQVTPAASNPAAQLSITGTSNRTSLPDSSYSSYGVSFSGGFYGSTLRATNGAGISVTGINQNLQPALNLTGGVIINAASGGNVTLRGQSAVSGNATAVVDVSLTAGGQVRVLANDVTVGGSFQSTATGDALVVAGATTANTTNFANSGGTFSTPNGRWLVYGLNPGTVSATGLAHDFRQYNASFGVANALTPATGNGILYSLAPTITLSGANLSKTYDGTTASGPLSPSGVSFGGLQSGDVASLASGASGTYIDKDAGSGKVVNVSSAAVTVVGADGKPVLGYGLSSSLLGDILRKSISLGTATAANKVYDGTQVASVTLSGLVGLVGSETLGTTATGSFDTKDVGTAKPVSVSVSLSNGSNGGLTTNYVLASSTTSASADITPKGLSFGTVTASNKVYDGSTLANVNLGPLSGLVGTETLNATATGAFVNKDVGTGKLVNVSGTLSNGANGGLASNYVLSPTTTTTNADITPRTVFLTGASAANKVYDGSNVASVSVAGVSGLVGSETLTVNSSGNFLTPDAGTGKVVAITASIANGANGGLASNYALSSPSTSALATISQAPLTITASNASKVFGTTLSFAGTEFTTSPLVGGQTVGSVTLTSAGAAATASVAGGPYAIIPSAATGGTFNPANYQITYVNGVLTVTPANLSALVVGIVGNPSKVYDGSTVATLAPTNYSLSGFVGSDAATINQTVGQYDSANAGARTVTATLATANYVPVGSTDLRNYSLPTSASGAGLILPKPLTVVGLTANNKAYDGTVLATLSNGGSLSGLVGTQTLVLSNGGASFNNKDVGTGKTVTVIGLTLGNGSNGGLASNYTLSGSVLTSADITRAPLTITANSSSKVFGNTLSFAGTEFTSSSMAAGESVGSVTLTSAGAAATASVAGGPYAIIPSAATGGSFNPANYQITYVNGVLTVTPANLSAVLVNIVGNPSKVYDGSTVATLAPANYTLTGFLGADAATINQTVGQYDSANAGARTVTATLGATNFSPVGSTDLRNYTLPTSASGSGTITPRPLTVIGITANNKVYDGNVLATLSNTGSLSGLVGTQTLGLVSTSASFDNKDAGAGKTVTVTGLSLSNGSNGGLATNYVLSNNSATTTADVSRAPLTITANSSTKVFGNTVSFAGTEFSTSPLVAGEIVGSVSLSSAGAVATASVAGGPYAIIPSAATGGTFNPANYQINYVNGLLTVNPADLRTVLVNLVGNPTKVYDGTDVAALTPANYSLTGFIGSDAATITQTTGRYDSANAGNRTVTVSLATSNFSPSGSTDLRNYTLPTTVSGSGTIVPRQLSLVGLTANNKAYDGNVLATVASLGSLNGLVGSQTLGLVTTGANFDNKDAGNGKTVTVTGITLANGGNGGLASNYVLASSSATTTADITPRTVTLNGVSAANKAYDGNTLASVTLGGLSGLVGSEQLGTSGSGNFDNKDAGTGKTVTVTGITLANGGNGGLASNYVLANASATTTANITPRPITVGGISAANKVYDGNSVASVSIGALNGLVGNETLLTSASGRFDNQNVGQNKPVAVTVGLSNGSNGGLASNYQLSGSTSTQASITPVTLTYTANPADKVVGAPLPPLSGSVTGFVAGETQATATTGSLGFVTPATPTSPAGQYAVNGSGLAATNYVFSQAPGNATALTVRGLPAQQPDDGSRAALGQSLVAVTLKSAFSSSTEGRVLDVMPALLSSYLGQGTLFTQVSVGSLSQDQLSGLLAARDRYKKNLFAEAIHRLEQDPTLADVRPCQSVKEVDNGTCLITDEIKRQIIAEREALQAAPAPAAQAGTPAAGRPTPGSPSSAPAPAPTQGTGPTQLAVAPPVAPAPFFRRKVRTAALPQIERKIAVVIGIDRYTDTTIPQLDNAVGDARAIGKLLESSLGYETVVLENASKQSIVRTFNRLATDLGPRDSVVIYYAGHGELVEASKLGYWQLSDSDAKRPETWLSNADISRLIGQIGASQVALISDSCYSGSLVDERIRGTAPNTDPRTLLERKTVVVMSSGGNEPVFDAGRDGHSPFAYNLMASLRQVSNWQTGGNLFERVRFAVARELPQRPRYGTASAAGHQLGGDYLFEQRQLDVQ